MISDLFGSMVDHRLVEQQRLIDVQGRLINELCTRCDVESALADDLALLIAERRLVHLPEYRHYLAVREGKCDGVV